MTDHTAQIPGLPARLGALAAGVLALASVGLVLAQPITGAQRATATQVAQTGVPLEELAANAPDEYTVKRGDTLWAVSRVYLQRPWRWPELWGMNMQEVRNPHRIYPGQVLVLDKSGGRARLRVRGLAVADDPSGAPMQTIRVSPRTRFESLADNALPTLRPSDIEPFLDEPVVMTEAAFRAAPRIVATQDQRVLITRGDRAYVVAAEGAPRVAEGPTTPRDYRVYRGGKPLSDLITGEVLGYEALYVGKAELVKPELVRADRVSENKIVATPVAATFDIVAAKEEIRAGDRVMPEPPRQFVSYVPRAPERPVDGHIISMYGNAVANAAQSQIVVINKGAADGMESGQILAIWKKGRVVRDRPDGGTGPGTVDIALPPERIGLMMVFRPFERVSYALVLEITDSVELGDRVGNPQR